MECWRKKRWRVDTSRKFGENREMIGRRAVGGCIAVGGRERWDN